MLSIKELSPGVFEIKCDGFDVRLFRSLVRYEPDNLIDFALSIVNGTMKDSIKKLYPDKSG